MTNAASAPIPIFHFLKQLTPDYWFILLLIFLMKTGQFMLLPYLALYLTYTTHVSAAWVGVAVGIGPLVYGMMGPLNGYLIDKFGRRPIIFWSVFFAGVVFIGFNFGKSVFYFSCMNALIGMTRSAFDTASRSYKMHVMPMEFRRVWFSVLFTVWNAGAGLGPVIGLFFIQHDASMLFLLNGTLFLLLAGFIFFVMKNDDGVKTATLKLGEVFSVLKTDRRLQAIVFGFFLMWVSYAQLDSIFGLYLTKNFPNGMTLLTWTFVLNTVGCVLLQIPMVRWMSVFSEKKQIIFGTAAYAGGFLIIPFALHIPALFLGCFFVLLGEIIIAPLIDMLVYKIAPTHLSGSYSGALALSVIGVGIGPMLGGYFYEYVSAQALFILCAALFVLMGALLWRARSKI